MLEEKMLEDVEKADNSFIILMKQLIKSNKNKMLRNLKIFTECISEFLLVFTLQ